MPRVTRVSRWLLPLVLLAACAPATPPPFAASYEQTLDVTQSPLIVATEEQALLSALGPEVESTASFYTDQPVESARQFFAKRAAAAAFLDPGTTLRLLDDPRGLDLRIVGGVTSGGAALVAKKGITSAAALRGRSVAAAPDSASMIALRTWLRDSGVAVGDDRQAGQVTVVPQSDLASWTAFTKGQLDAVWVPELWVSRLTDAGGRILVDERDLWPGRQFVSAQLVVSTALLQARPQIVTTLLKQAKLGTRIIAQRPDNAAQLFVNTSGAPADPEAAAGGDEPLFPPDPTPAQVKRAWSRMTFTDDPLASTFLTMADRSRSLGLTSVADGATVARAYDLTPLNELRRENSEPEVPAPAR